MNEQSELIQHYSDLPDGRKQLEIIAKISDVPFMIHHLPMATFIGKLEQDMKEIPYTPARGYPIVSNGLLGVDLLYLPAGTSFPMHTHPGHHLLYILRGDGTVTFDGIEYATEPGDLYMVNANVEHAVGAHPNNEHWLLSYGAPHVPIDSPERMAVVEN